MKQFGPPPPPSYGPPPRQSWWARLDPAPKVFLILAGAAVALCLAPTVLIAAVSQVDAPPAERPASTTAKGGPSSSSAAQVVRSTAAEAPAPPAIQTTTVAPPPPPPLPPPPPPPPPQSQCHSSYEGACVPIASDVDCEGGTGDGPAYVRGPVTVVGPDVYGLDHDNDGMGCE